MSFITIELNMKLYSKILLYTDRLLVIIVNFKAYYDA